MSKIVEMKTLYLPSLLLIIISVWPLFVQVSAADDHVLKRFSHAPLNVNEVSERTAVDKALSEFPGEVLSVKALSLDTEPVFRVQILSSSGRVRVLYIHRLSGDLIR